MRRVLIDSGAIYAFVTRTDAHHHRARTFVKAHLARQGVFVLVDAVFAETMTLLKARLGPELAVRVGRELRLNPVYNWITLGPEGERDTWAIFEKYSDNQWSYTDCAVLVIAQRLQIPGVFSFDDHFTQIPFVERVPARA